MKRITGIKGLVRGVGTFTALSLLASFANFLFNFIMIRLLSVQEFRDLTLANNMINVFGNLFVALNIISIAVFYMAKEQQTDIIRACQKIIYALYVILLGACVLFSGQVQQRTGLHDAILLNLTLTVIFFSIPVMVLNAIYLGANRFNRSAILNVCLSFGRLILGVAGAILIATHKDVSAIAGILLVFVIVFSLFIVFDKQGYRQQNAEIFKRIWGAPMHFLKRYRGLVIASVMYAITVNFLLGLDLFMFGQFFSNSESADYAAVSIIGKLIFFFIAPISVYLATKQQQFVKTKPGMALKASLTVNLLVIGLGIFLALVPTEAISMLIHRSVEDINHQYLLLSVLFNAAVVITNHQVIEGILVKRERFVIVVTGILLAMSTSLFLFFDVLTKDLDKYSPAMLALGIPAVAMIVASMSLFFASHIMRRKHTTDASV